MVSLTLSVPEDLKQEMDQFPEMNWSEIARAAIKKRLLLMKRIREFSKESDLTEEDAVRIGRKVNEGLMKRYRAA